MTSDALPTAQKEEVIRIVTAREAQETQNEFFAGLTAPARISWWMTTSKRVTLRALDRRDAEAIVARDRAGRTGHRTTPRRVTSSSPSWRSPGASGVRDGHGAVGTLHDHRTAQRSSIGGIGFKGSPNEHGEVEIGYGICEWYQGRGVATDAVRALCDLARPRAAAVLAETELENVASQRVLAKAGFEIYDQTHDLVRWRRVVDRTET